MYIHMYVHICVCVWCVCKFTNKKKKTKAHTMHHFVKTEKKHALRIIIKKKTHK
jgi:hypothetical protein